MISKATNQLVEDWLGQATVEDCVELLVSIANGEYSPEAFMADLQTYT